MQAATPNRRNFLIGRAAVTMISRNDELLKLAGDWLAGFELDNSKPTAEGTGEESIRPIRFTMIGYETNYRVPFPIPADAELLYKNDYTRYYQYRGLWIVLLQSALVIVNRTMNKITAFVHYRDLRRSKYLEDYMHPLVELLRQNGVFAHHAAAVSQEGRGLLILGKSGQGKTTLSVDLLHHGFDFLADDRCFIQCQGSGLEAIGFYEPIRYYPTNISHIPAVRDSEESRQLPVLYNGKNQLDLQPLFRERIISRSMLTALVFPFYNPKETVSRVEPMPPGEALIAVLPLTLVCFDRSTSRTHFEFCVNLTSVLPAVKLIMGQDRENWHILVRQYLNSLPQG